MFYSDKKLAIKTPKSITHAVSKTYTHVLGHSSNASVSKMIEDHPNVIDDKNNFKFIL